MIHTRRGAGYLIKPADVGERAADRRARGQSGPAAVDAADPARRLAVTLIAVVCAGDRRRSPTFALRDSPVRAAGDSTSRRDRSGQAGRAAGSRAGGHAPRAGARDAGRRRARLRRSGRRSPERHASARARARTAGHRGRGQRRSGQADTRRPRSTRTRSASGADRPPSRTCPATSKPHTVDLPAASASYRVESTRTGDDGAFLVGLPDQVRHQDTRQHPHRGRAQRHRRRARRRRLAGAAIDRRRAAPAAPGRRDRDPGLRTPAAQRRGGPARAGPGRREPTRTPRSGRSARRSTGCSATSARRLHARQESETRVRQFVADASHELRTPLASIRGYAELTRRGREEIGPDTRHALGRIESEAARMTGLVEDLLLLARLDAGRPLSVREHRPLPAGRGRCQRRARGRAGPQVAARAARRTRDGTGRRAPGSIRSWSICWRTPARTPRPGRPSPRACDAAGPAVCWSRGRRSGHPARPPAARLRTVRARRRVPGPGPPDPPGSGSPSCRRWSPRTAARWRCDSEPGRTVFAVHLPAARRPTASHAGAHLARDAFARARLACADSQTGHRHITRP